MDLSINNHEGPAQALPNVQLVRNILGFLAAHHPKIKPDDVPALSDELLDWDKLVEVDFLREWQQSIAQMKEDWMECIRESGHKRAELLSGSRSLAVLFEAAKKSPDAFSDLQCAAIVIGNLIEDSIANYNPKLAWVVQLQVNSFWNASANQALREADFGGYKIGVVLPEHTPRAPELED